MRILVVDDERALRSSLKRALEMEGYMVFLACDGQEALDRLEKETFDAIVLDVSMPGVDGLQVARRLRATGDRTPILMLTARDAVDDRVDGLDAGADDYLVKPFVLKELHARLRALLRRIDPPKTELRLADLRMDPLTRDVYRGDRQLELSRTEHSLALRRDLGLDLLDRLWERNQLPEEEATALAVEAQHKTRRRRR